MFAISGQSVLCMSYLWISVLVPVQSKASGNTIHERGCPNTALWVVQRLLRMRREQQKVKNDILPYTLFQSTPPKSVAKVEVFSALASTL